jgi:hypothetical protein
MTSQMSWDHNSSLQRNMAGLPTVSSVGTGLWQQQHIFGGGSDNNVPALRCFTFLRLGPEILNPSNQALWMRFMYNIATGKTRDC